MVGTKDRGDFVGADTYVKDGKQLSKGKKAKKKDDESRAKGGMTPEHTCNKKQEEAWAKPSGSVEAFPVYGGASGDCEAKPAQNLWKKNSSTVGMKVEHTRPHGPQHYPPEQHLNPECREKGIHLLSRSRAER